jgi:hypothetical protein
MNEKEGNSYQTSTYKVFPVYGIKIYEGNSGTTPRNSLSSAFDNSEW